MKIVIRILPPLDREALLAEARDHREREARRRALAAAAAGRGDPEIHLDLAEKYRILAEKAERQAAKPPAARFEIRCTRVAAPTEYVLLRRGYYVESLVYSRIVATSEERDDEIAYLFSLEPGSGVVMER